MRGSFTPPFTQFVRLRDVGAGAAHCATGVQCVPEGEEGTPVRLGRRRAGLLQAGERDATRTRGACQVRPPAEHPPMHQVPSAVHHGLAW